MIKTLKNLFFLVLLLLTLGLGYYLYVRTPALEDSTNMQLNGDVQVKAARFLTRLNELKQIELNSDVLSDERLSSLIDFSGFVPSEPVGKENPFASN
jgi:hypothetical protein